MKNVTIVDSTVWVDYFTGRDNAETRWLENAIGYESVGITDLILCEVLQGIRDDRQFAEIKRQLLDFEFFATASLDLAIAAAENYRALRSRGFTVRKTIACWIATFCLQKGFGLLHRDRDFQVFERALGLRAVKP
jgi:predicted nucleic acid-binding protein